jgi:hypothetical protein
VRVKGYIGFKTAMLKKTRDSASLRTETLREIRGKWDSESSWTETLRVVLM